MYYLQTEIEVVCAVFNISGFQSVVHICLSNNVVATKLIMFVTLRFYATGSFLQAVADSAGIDTATACKIVYKVSRAIARIEIIFIKLPSTNEKMQLTAIFFIILLDFQGALDCTYVKIIFSGGNQDVIFRNTKGFFL